MTTNDEKFLVIDLGTGSESKAWAINNEGQVVGDIKTSSGESRAFIFTDENSNDQVDYGEIQNIDTPESSESAGRDINDQGQVVGFLPPLSSQRAFMWDQDQGMEIFRSLGASAQGINNDGDAVGFFKVPPFNFHSIRWENGQANPLKTPVGNSSWATSINDSGSIVGYTDVFGGASRGFLLNGDNINDAVDIGSLDAAIHTQAWDINNRSEVVGGSGSAAFLWSSFQPIQDLGSLGAGSSKAFAINESTQVVGKSDNRAFLWEDLNNNKQSDPNEMVDLNDLIPADSGWNLQEARDINEAGEIVGWGTLNGETRAFLLVPQESKSADLSVITIDSPDPITIGDNLTYTLVVTNKTAEDATEVVLTDVLPKDVDFVQATTSQGEFIETDGTVRFELGKIEGGKEATAKIVVKPTQRIVPDGEKPPTSWEITNTATVEASQTEPEESNNLDRETTKVEKGSLDTTPLKLSVRDGEFADIDNDGKLEADGTIYIGRTDGIDKMLRVENATAEHDDKELTISGKVYSEIGNVKAPLFQGSFTMPFKTATTTAFSETNKLSNEYELAGRDVKFEKLTLESNQILLGSKFDLPADAGGKIVKATGKDALLIDREGVKLGRGGKISVGNIPKFSAFGFDTELSDLSVEYVPPEDKLKLQGKATFDSFTKTPLKKITADFSGKNYIEIKDDQLVPKGSLVVEGDLKIGEKWGLREVKLEVDTNKKDIGGSAKLELPFARIPTGEFEIGFKLPISPLELNKVAGSVDRLNIPIPGFAPLRFQKFGLGLENFAPSDSDPIEGTITTAATLGPQLRGGFSLIRLDLTGNINSEQIKGQSTVTMGKIPNFKTIGQIKGEATLNWDKKFFEAKGNLSLLDGLIIGESNLRTDSNINLSAGGKASVNVPKVIPFFGNQSLASGNFILKFSNDNNLNNDFVAGWGTLWDQALGFKVNFNGEWDWLGMEDVPTVGKNFRVQEDKDTLLLNADWEGENIQRRSSQSNVLIEIQTPDGKWIEESEFAANNIQLVDNLGDSTQKTVLVSDPQAGEWNIRVAQESLGKVEYSALQNTSGAPTLELKPAVVDDQKSTVTFDYEAFDANSKAEISFFYDTDNKDFNGTLIKDGVVEKDQKDRFVWNTADVPDGKYYIYGIIEDENNLPVMTYSPVEITVGNPLPDGEIKVGNSKKNKLKGTGKDDLLDGKGGNDILIGSNGNDTLIGGGGKDQLNGGKGDDTYQLNAKTAKGDRIIDSGGNDILELEGANISLEGLAKRKTGVGRKGKNLIIDLNQDGKVNVKQDLTIKNFFADNKTNKPGKGLIETVDNVTGEEIIDSLTNPNQGVTKNGNKRNNTLKGGKLNDVLNGKGGNDKLLGNNGDDTLTGGNGNDKLNGGKGEDILTGGKGKDSFILADFNKTETDEITDFILGEDKLILDKSAFRSIKSRKGNGFSRQREFEIVDDAADVASSKAFIVYNENSGELLYNSNGKKAGLGNGGLFAKLEGAPDIGANDFNLV